MKNCLLKSENLVVEHHKTTFVRKINLECLAGDIVLVIGVNGSGKTSLMNLMSGHQELLQGDVFFKENNIKGLSIKSKASFSSYLPQFIEKIDDLFVKDYLEMGLNQSNPAINTLLDMININSLLDKKMGQLSGGELKKLAFYSSLKANPTVLLLDEPLQNLDPQTKLMFKNVILGFAKLGKGIVITSHDFLWTTNFANKVYGIHENELIEGTMEPSFFSKVMKYPFIKQNTSIVPETGVIGD